MGDMHGDVVHLGERECSIQRRNQKVIEESPSAGISPDIRTALCDGALALARAVGYHGAGTVEFLVGLDGTVNFLEVNTRLQVEHPVTEAVTGLDLVELQLLVAAGEPLPITQEDVRFDGHAIEVRVVAEDPSAGWLPSTGTVRSFQIGDGVRVDTGIRAGATVSADYDSLLAKVVAHAPTRAQAAHTLARALRSSQVSGVRTNIEAMANVLLEADFLAAATPTAYLDEHPATMVRGRIEPADDDVAPARSDGVALLLAAVFAREQADREIDPVLGFAPSGWRNLRTQGQREIWIDWATGDEHPVEFVFNGRDRAVVMLGPWPHPGPDGAMSADDREPLQVRLLSRSETRQVIEVDGMRSAVDVHLPHGPSTTATTHDVVEVRSRTGAGTFERAPVFEVHDADVGGSGPISPLPGTVIAVHVSVGDARRRGPADDGGRSDEDGAQDHGVDGCRGERSAVRRRRSGRHRRPPRRLGDRGRGGVARVVTIAPSPAPIRIANCSGFFGDRPSGALEMVEGGPIDVLTGDWLAELTMLILSRIRAKRPGAGFARTFVDQMEQVMGTCLDRGIKVVSNAGGLDPGGCADAVAEVADRLGLAPTIAYVDGDDLMPRLPELLAIRRPPPLRPIRPRSTFASGYRRPGPGNPDANEDSAGFGGSGAVRDGERVPRVFRDRRGARTGVPTS